MAMCMRSPSPVLQPISSNVPMKPQVRVEPADLNTDFTHVKVPTVNDQQQSLESSSATQGNARPSKNSVHIPDAYAYKTPYTPPIPSPLSPRSSHSKSQQPQREATKPGVPALRQQLLKDRALQLYPSGPHHTSGPHNIKALEFEHQISPEKNVALAPATSTRPSIEIVTVQADGTSNTAETVSVSPSNIQSLPIPVQHAVLCSSLRHVFLDLALGVSPAHHPAHPSPPIPAASPPANAAQQHLVKVAEPTLPVDHAAMDVDDIAEQDNNEDNEDEEDEEVDQLIDDDPPAPTHRRRRTPPKKPKHPPALFHPPPKHTPPTGAPPKRPHPANWSTTARAATPAPAPSSTRPYIQGHRMHPYSTGARAGRGRSSSSKSKMDFRTDRVAKPLTPIPAPHAQPGRRHAADSVVADWVARLAAVFAAGAQAAEAGAGSGVDVAARREFRAKMDAAAEAVAHMRASVPGMKVDVLERTGLARSLRTLTNFKIDERWDPRARELVEAVAGVAETVRRKVRGEGCAGM